MKNTFFIVLKTIIGFITYSFFFSLFYSVRLDIINLNLNFSKFLFTDFLSWMFLLVFYTLLGYKIILLFSSFYLIEKVGFLSKNKPISYMLFFLLVFFFGSLIFDSNFYVSTRNLNEFLYSCLSICISSIIVYRLEKLFIKWQKLNK